MNTKVSLISLGCAKNLVDSEHMLARLRAAGCEITQDMAEAEVAVINTCGFIESAKTEAIETILETAQYKQTGALRGLAVTGCLLAFLLTLAARIKAGTVFSNTLIWMLCKAIALGCRRASAALPLTWRVVVGFLLGLGAGEGHLAFIGMDVDGGLLLMADQFSVFVPALRAVVMGDELLLPAGKLIAVFRVGMVFEAAVDALPLQGNGGQDQGVGGTEHHHRGDGGENPPETPAALSPGGILG